MKLFKKKSNKMDRKQKEALQSYKEAFLAIVEIEYYKDYIREMPDKLKEKEEQTYDKQVEAIIAMGHMDETLDSIEKEAIEQANRNIIRKYGQPPEPDMDHVESVKKLHPDAYQQVIACGIVKRLIDENKYDRGGNDYVHALYCYDLGHDILMHTNETDACVDAVYDDIIRNDNKEALQHYIKMFEDFADAKENEKNRFLAR